MLLDWFEEAFERYLPSNPLPNSNPVTTSEKPGQNSFFETSLAEAGFRSQCNENTCENGHGDGVTDSNPQVLEAQADLL